MSRSIGVPDASATGVGAELDSAVADGVATAEGVGMGVDVGVGLGVGVEVGEGVGDSSTTSVCRLEEPPRVQRIAPMASRRTIATPMERTSVGDKPRFGPMDSRGEPHSGHRNSFVTTVIFSFR